MTHNISIDDKAYAILKSHKLEGESFSDVIKKQIALALVGKELDDYLDMIARQEDNERNSRRHRMAATAGARVSPA